MGRRADPTEEFSSSRAPEAKAGRVQSGDCPITGRMQEKGLKLEFPHKRADWNGVGAKDTFLLP